MPFDPNPSVTDNELLREPQREGFTAIRDHFRVAGAARQVSIVLPVGCGKSGLIAITPFAVPGVRRVLVVAPSTKIRDQLAADMRANSPTNFYERCGVLGADSEFPETILVATGRVNADDIANCEIAVSNIHQIAGEQNRWLDGLPADFFDLILMDEGHHNVAESWQQLHRRFPAAKVVNYSATPNRADGQLMEGRVIYSYPVVSAIERGYVKRLRAKMLSPAALRYVDNATGQEVEIGPADVRRLGEEDAEFRRGIVMSPQTLTSIVDYSIAELNRLRTETGELRLKIIASAMNLNHCVQVTEAFRARGLRAAYVHSREGGAANDRVFEQLENHELDVIVQARMLGEGFDHKYLAVAMVGSIFANLSPFVQFVGRVMRAIEQGRPGHPTNQGVVVFHVGANVARRWDDFRNFSAADQQYFAELLPEAEAVDFTGREVVDSEPGGGGLRPVDVIAERDVRAADLVPIGDPATLDLIRQLAERGVTPEQAAEALRRQRVTRQDQRIARRASLNERVTLEVGAILGRLQIPHRGKTLDRTRRRHNYEWLVAELNTRVDASVDQGHGRRQDFTLDELNTAHDALPAIAAALEQEIRNGQ